PLPVVVRHELVDGAEQPTFPEEDQAVETFRPDRAHEVLRVGVGIGRLDGRQHDPYPRALDDTAESVRPLAVTIADEHLVARQEPVDRIGESPRRLRHEPPIRGRCRARHVNPSAPARARSRCLSGPWRSYSGPRHGPGSLAPPGCACSPTPDSPWPSAE